jgi:hypothetical protein
MPSQNVAINTRQPVAKACVRRINFNPRNDSCGLPDEKLSAEGELPRMGWAETEDKLIRR